MKSFNFFEFFVSFQDFFWFAMKLNLVWLLFSIIPIILISLPAFIEINPVLYFYILAVAFIGVFISVVPMIKISHERIESKESRVNVKMFLAEYKKNIKPKLLIAFVAFMLLFILDQVESNAQEAMIQGAVWLLKVIFGAVFVGALFELSKSSDKQIIKSVILLYLKKPVIFLINIVAVILVEVVNRFIPIGVLFGIPAMITYFITRLNKHFYDKDQEEAEE